VNFRISGTGQNFNADSIEQYYRIKACEIYDMAIMQLNERFDEGKSGIASYLKLSSCAVNMKIDEDMVDNLQQYPELNVEALRCELAVLESQRKKNLLNLNDVVLEFRERSIEVRALFPNYEELLRLLLVRPVGAVECERSFSSLRRLKTWLRSTMKASRLNAVAILNVHQKKVDEISIDELVSDFVNRNEWRQKTFGI